MRPFFYTMLFLILYITTSYLFSQNFNYHDDDWFILSNPGIITSITVTNDKVIFSAENGVYSYDKYNQEIEYIDDYTKDFDTEKYHLIHYDKFRDFLWILTDDNIAYKPYTSTFWREIEFYELGVNAYYNIFNIGSNHEYLFLNIGSKILILDPHTGNSVALEDYNYSNVNWTNSYRYTIDESINLTDFYSFEGYNIISNDKIEFNGSMINITSSIKDGSYIWLGTDLGDLFRCDMNLNVVEKINALPQFSNVNFTYLDNYDEWWITNNDRILLNNSVFIGNNQIFLSRWIQNKNQWIYYYQNKYLNIKSKDVTSIYRIKNSVYLGTHYGLLIFDFLKNTWLLLNENSGLENNFITDIEYYNNSLIVSTKKGIQFLNIEDNMFYYSNMIKFVENSLVYKITIKNDNLYVLSDIGFLKYNLISNIYKFLSNDRYNKFETGNSEKIILANNRKIEQLIDDEIEILGYFNDINDILLCDEDYLWINLKDRAILMDLINREEFEYNSSDGISGKNINHLGCDDYWIWFSTNKGLSFYNWRKYHNETD